MLLGMLGQIFCGNLTGLVDTYQLHIYFRCITSVCCTITVTAGQAICKVKQNSLPNLINKQSIDSNGHNCG